MKYPNIDWQLLPKAIDYYEGCGYKYVEVPWLLSKKALSSTLPEGKHGCRVYEGDVSLGYLPGSAEQSFVQMILDGQINPGKYCAITPCFRDEDPGDLHFKYFVKLELIEIGYDVDCMTCNSMLKSAFSFFKKISQLPTTDVVIDSIAEHKNGLYAIYTDQGYDIEINGIEIGSYGVREYLKYKWVYGTGLALPRFSQALSIK